MRILIYIEPFPVRQTMDHYQVYATAFAKMLLSESAAEHLKDFDIRIYANRETLAHVQEEALAAKRFFLRPESQEQDQFRASLTEWAIEGLRAWTSLLKGEGEVTQEYQRIFEQIYQRFAFDVVVTVGDNGAAKAFAASANVDHVVLDLSLGRPSLYDSVVFDPLGAGGSSTLAQVNVSTIRSVVGKEAWAAPLDQACISALSAPELRPDSTGPIDFTGQDRILRRGNGRAALLCLQNFDDPLLRAHSKFSSPAEMIEACLPELADNGILTIVRPPKGGAQGPGQAHTINEARQTLLGFADMALWLDRETERVSDTRLYTLCDLVVTANGPSGLEAALFDKQVCLLGAAAYKPIGAFPNLKAIVSRHFDNRTYLKNLAALRAYMLRVRLVAHADVLSFDIFADRLVQTLDAWRDSASSPRLALEDSYARYSAQTTERLKSSLDPRQGERTVSGPSALSPERPSPGAIQSLNKSVSNFTSRARQSLGRKILQTGLTGTSGTGPLGSNPLFANSAQDQPPAPFSLPHYPLCTEDEQAVSTARKALQKRRRSSSTFAVVAHCFYRDTTERLVDRLQLVTQKFDLFATVPPFGGIEIKNQIRSAFPASKIITMPNRGRDIWPFSFILSELGTDKYTYVLKVHADKPHFEGDEIDANLGDAWLDYGLTCLLGEQGKPERIDEILDPNAACSMAGPYGFLQSTKQHTLELEFDAAAALPGLDHQVVPHHWTYFSSGMYWLNIKMLQSLINAFSKVECYAPGAIATNCQMRDFAKYAFALAAHQSANPVLSLMPGTASPMVNAAPEHSDVNEILQAFIASQPAIPS